MGTKQQNADRREAHVVEMEAQLKAWSTQLDGLVVGNIEAGGQSSDEYRQRIDGLRTRHGVVQTKLNEFTNPSGNSEAWGTFKAGIAEDWTALEAGFKDLTK